MVKGLSSNNIDPELSSTNNILAGFRISGSVYSTVALLLDSMVFFPRTWSNIGSTVPLVLTITVRSSALYSTVNVISSPLFKSYPSSRAEYVCPSTKTPGAALVGISPVLLMCIAAAKPTVSAMDCALSE